jgi:SAM-dependent methyltransferase
MNDSIKDDSRRIDAALTTKTITDFGEQWTIHQENPAYYGSVQLLQDLFGPLLAVEDLAHQRVADIGSGTGRIVNMLLDAGVDNVVAVEPSAAFEVLKLNTSQWANKVIYINDRGEALPTGLTLDLVVSMGVLHHIPQPKPVVDAAFHALRPGGKILVWLYGREGNGLYLSVITPVRALTTRLPHPMLQMLCQVLGIVLDAYIFLCSYLPLPMRSYMRNVLERFPKGIRRLAIYDQLNPAYSKYYTQYEAEELLRDSGFVDIESWHRHGYSWTVTGRKRSGIDLPTANSPVEPK